MWPNSRSVNYNPTANRLQSSQPQTNSMTNQSMSSMDSNQLLITANSLRSLFGDNINSNLLNSIRDNPSAKRMDTNVPQMQTQRAPERHLIDYESNSHYSRLDRNVLMSQMSTNSGRNDQQFDDSRPLRTDNQIYDPLKMPQKSILKKSKINSFESSNFRDVDNEDLYIYGESVSTPMTGSGQTSGALPPGIVSVDQRNQRSDAEEERSLSPISLRLKREMENMDRSRNTSNPKDGSYRSPRMGETAPEESVDRRNDWYEEEDTFKRRYQQLMNPSPEREDSLTLEKVRIQQMAAIQAGILKNEGKRSPPNSPNRGYPLTRRAMSPEMSPKRMRRRSPEITSRRRSVSPRRRSISPRFRNRRRSRSPSRDRYRRSRSRSNSRTRNRRRSRSPDRRRTAVSPDPINSRINQMNANLINPLTPMMPIPAQGFDLPFIPNPRLVGAHPMMGGFMGPINPMMTPFQPIIQHIPRMPFNQINRSVLKDVPIIKTSSQSSAKKELPKKEDKLLNPYDLLIAERSKLREEMNSFKRQYERKVDEQNLIVAKDGGKDSYAYRQLDKTLKDLRTTIESTHEKLTKNFHLIQEIQNSKTKAKEFMENLKITGDLSKTELKKKELNASPEKPKKPKEPEKPEKKSNPKPRNEKKNSVDEEEEDEKNCRFHYFDSGPHWCRYCDKFTDNMKQYFNHIHTKEHLNKEKESDRRPWITKEYIKQFEKQNTKPKDNKLVVPAKGIQFIHSMQGFYCQLCQQFMNDSYQTERHFKTAKHNRNYTRYTLEHNDYESKWKTERDKAFTEMKKKERELEKEKSKKEVEDKANKRKQLEEEVKRKDKEVKEKIEAMNKTLKSVKELDEQKVSPDKKEDNSKSSPKNIRLNLSSKTNESPNKLKNDNKKDEKVVKPSDESENKNKTQEKAIEVKEKISKINKIHENSEDIEDMLVIDEINCDSQDIQMEDKESEEIIDENKLLYPESSDDKHLEQKSVENETQIIGKSFEITSESLESKQKPENNNKCEDNDNKKSEKSGNEKTCDEVEGVIPEMDSNKPKDISEEKTDSKTDENIGLNNKLVDNIGNNESNTEKMSENTQMVDTKEAKEDQKSSSGCVDNKAKSYAEVVAKGSVVSDPKETPDKSNDKEVVEEVKSGSNAKNTNNNENAKNCDKNGVKNIGILDIDDDIAKFNERFESMVKKEETEPEYEDELEGFDVIDSVNNQEVIDLSD